MNVAIATGGTGGHIFPALALADALRARGDRAVFLIDARAARTYGALMPGAHVIAGAGFSGRGVRAVAAAGGVARGVAQAIRVLRATGVSALVAFGGYMSVAPVLAATVLGLRVVLHEQNAVMGRANRMLARLADVVAVSFAGTRNAPAGVVLTGNPVRAEFAQTPPYAAPGGVARVLVLGGSLGARAFASIPGALAEAGGEMRVTQQCRADDVDAVRATYQAAGIPADVAAFFDDVPRLMGEAHLVISRAGASSVAEIALAGRPSILIPLPGAIDDHQRANAEMLAGAAALLPQTEIASLSAIIRGLLNEPRQLEAMARACVAVASPDAARRLADLVRA